MFVCKKRASNIPRPHATRMLLAGFIATFVLAVSLAGCGGGGGGTTPSAAVPQAQASASVPLPFTSTAVGGASAAQTITLSNPGTAALAISSITSTTADFKLGGGTCVPGGAVAVGNNCTIIVSFNPTAAGAMSGTVTIASNGTPSSLVVSLSGIGTPVEPQAITTVPAFSYTDQRKADALNRLNAIRASVGLGLVAQQTQIDTAAQAHSDYQVTNDVMTHSEDSTKPGFTGVDAGARMTASGSAWKWWSEVIAWGTNSGAQSVDLLVSLPYHRAGMLEYAFTTAGVGSASSTLLNALTIDMAYPPGGQQGAPNTPAAVLPAAYAVGVPKSMLGYEVPNPIPENNGSPAGYPVSLQVNESKVLTVTSFTIALADGTIVPTKLLEPSSDATLLTDNIKFFACALPRSPLAANTTYTANFVGTVDGAPFSKSWSFTTGP